ncbi:MAG: hypothetical protein SAJ12_13900 [Jaaginema sp. PMC 1079.18]|nr:hypothetical protein [Jaaginema sp. PMC 1080.18]MEC4852075.1 hypothetical protein [Jaaginema sp. PMC 1079.18]MEC4867255.1 hypothetical protein [Jaaginema sp. PMC 1078.18]
MRLFANVTRPLALSGLLAIASPVILGTTPPFLQSASAQMQPTEMEMQAWETFISEAGRFSAAFPGIPTENIQEGSRVEGETPSETLTDYGASGEIALEYEDSNSGYFVFYQDFPVPGGLISDEQIANILATATEALAENDNEILNEREIEIDGYQGKEVEVQMPGSYMKARMYWVNARLYFVVGGAPTPEDAIALDTDRFLDSFTLIE